MSNRVLILFAHPLFEKSRVNKTLVSDYPAGVTFHDLYEHYPDFNIDIEKEKQLLTDHDIIIWQHPIYWYSCPALLKQWIDLVLEAGWAYGPGGIALKGKSVFQVITTGAPEHSYHEEANNRFTIRQFLAPFDQTATLCKMDYLPPFVTHGSHRIHKDQVDEQTAAYHFLLDYLANNDLDIEALKKYNYLNDWVKENQQL
ncbi:NAD(P)H-dependent oxidoreductase [Dyadobacter sp. CY356]|uniref:glutathione-regulated potassium-efflux system oxidoreductase KefF n=1 Tax=Dyadobacter sp. CY356 TaxID=2906442 RepID=UPI001F2614DD|nr:NAD(P)H-dependent oxidoreductase [Dyadobacter sp. CY356]MCF0056221.1 NAD(P)H-dependent oxidoreductase [Dyadobacter sp. CY356]